VNNLAQKLGCLRDGIHPPWDEQRQARVLRGVARLQHRHRNLVAATTVTCASLLSFGVGYATLSRQHAEIMRATANSASLRLAAPPIQHTPPSVEAAPPSARRALTVGAPVRLADGSDATANPNSQLFLEVDRPEQVVLQLAAGSAHFEVVPNKHRNFSVYVDSLEVAVVGTSFDVERSDKRMRVAVKHGKVRVRGSSSPVYVQAGEALWFDLEPDPLSESSAERAAHGSGRASTPNKREPARHSAGGRTETSRIEWRTLNQDGDVEGAYRLLEQGAAVDDSVEALMEAADAARIAGHLDQTVRYLRKAVADHRPDPAAPLAAFTLGRLLLGQLGRPSEAAEAFATVRALAPEGDIAQDALAREVEAWSKAGRLDQAYVRAQLFIQSYPESRRRRVVEFYGGLGAPAMR